MTTLVVPADPRRFSWSHGNTIGWFEPSGRMKASTRDAALLREVTLRSDKAILSARLVVGLADPDGARRTIDDIAAIVRRQRVLQVGAEATVTVARTGTLGTGLGPRGGQRITTEDAAEVLVVNLPAPGARRAVFERQVMEIAEGLAVEFGRDEVVVQLQKAGLQVRVIGVRPP